MIALPSNRKLRQVAATLEGREMLREQREQLTAMIRHAESSGRAVPRKARKMLERLNRILGDAGVLA